MEQRRVSKDEAEKIAGRLDALRPHVHGTVYQRAMEDAASAIRALAKRKLPAVEDESFRASDYQLDLDIKGKEMRLIFAQKARVLSYMILDSLQAADLAETIMSGFDDLEGIK